jgi:hypothetical protein
LLVAVSPMVLDAIIIANMSVIVGLCIAVGVIEMIRRREALSATGIVAGGVTKYATLALLPLALVARRWKVVAYSLLFAAILLGGTYAVTRAEPFNTYRRQIAPTLSRTHSIDTNQSLPSFLQRVRHQAVLSRPMKYALFGIEAVVLLGLLWLLVSRPRAFWDEPANIFAGAAALLTFLLIFSPVFWHHYAVYLCPLWGWLLWEGGRWKIALLPGIAAIALTYVPFTYLYDLRDPFNTHMLPAVMLIFAMAVWRIASKPRAEAVGDAAGPRAAGAEESGASAAPSASGLD